MERSSFTPPLHRAEQRLAKPRESRRDRVVGLAIDLVAAVGAVGVIGGVLGVVLALLVTLAFAAPFIALGVVGAALVLLAVAWTVDRLEP